MTDTPLAHRYKLTRSLGQGGMGHVWLAEDVVRGDEVAVKVLSEQMAANQASVLQLKQEFRLMTQLRHPNCCEVHDYGFLPDGKPYFTMEVVPGDGMDGLVPMPPDRFRPLMIQLLRALGYVHQRGYVHCDIKSENVRVRPDGTLKLMDFGLMLNAGASGLPIRGTLGYLPPEVIKRGAIDQRADLYAVGCLAFEALVGQLPFPRAKAMEVIQAHLQDTPPIPNRLVDAEGVDWVPILTRLLAKEPVARFQAADDVLEALGEAVDDTDGDALLAAQLVGRDAELSALQAVIDRIRTGGAGGAIALEGAEGMGKSRLLAELRIRAQLEHVPFGLGAFHRHGTSPLSAVVASVRALLPALRESCAPLLAELGPALVHLLPELEMAPAAELDSPDKEKARLFDALARLVIGLGTARGAVLALEDWQWADALSVEFVTYLLRNMAGAPVLVVLSLHARPAEAAWADFVEWMTLGGLDAPATATLIGSILGVTDVPQAFLDKMVALSQGNPQVIENALQHLVETLVLHREHRRWQFSLAWDESRLPINRLGILHRRLSFLSAPARALAEAAAVIGRPMNLADLNAVARLSDDALFAHLDQLLEHQILKRDEAHVYVLAHESLVELLYDRMDPAARRALHVEALRDLERTIEGRALHQLPLEHLSQLARHAVGADDRPAAIRYALEAGKRSTIIYANDEAARLLGLGLALVRQAPADVPAPVLVDYLRFLADVYRVTGRYAEALPLYTEAIALAGSDALTLGRVRTSLAKLHLLEDRLDEAVTESRLALEATAGATQGPVTLRAMLTEVRALFYLGRGAEAKALADDALGRARALGGSILIAQALSLRGYLEVASSEPDVEAGVGYLREAVARFSEGGDRLGLNNAYNLLGDALMTIGELDEAHSVFERYRQLAFEIGVKDDEVFAWLNLALADLERGRPLDSREAAKKAATLAAGLKSKFTAGLASAIEATARLQLGEGAGVERQLDAVIALAREIKSPYMESNARQYQAEALLHLGAYGPALEAVLAWAALTPDAEPGARAATIEGAALSGLGRDAEATARLDGALAAARRAHAKGDEARARLALATHHARSGRPDDARPQLVAGLELAERIGARLVAAELRGLEGELALSSGQEAKAAFEAMHATTATAGAPALDAIALFGLAASSPYDPSAADLVVRAQARLDEARRGLDDAARDRFATPVARKRVAEGNHIAFSLPSAPRERRAPSGMMGFGFGM